MVGAVEPVVYVVDDDQSIREALEDLLTSVGLRVETFGSIQAFLDREPSDAPGCLVLDVRMPGQSGMDFQRRMSESSERIPTIMITGHGDIAMAVEAMKNGAIEFLAKPFRDQDLLDAIQLGLERGPRQTQPIRRYLGIGRAMAVAFDGRTGRDGAGGAGAAQQADRRRTGCFGNHGEGSTRPCDAQDASQDAGRPGENVRQDRALAPERRVRLCS